MYIIFFWKSRNGGEFMKLVPETESWNSEDQEFWNHEMRGSHVLSCDFASKINKHVVPNNRVGGNE